VDDDALLGNRLAGKEAVVLAGEAIGLAANIGQERPVIAQQCLRRRGRLPVRALAIGNQLPFTALRVIWTESRPLQVLPVHREFSAPSVRAVAELPEGGVLPRGIRADPPGTEGTPVVREVARQDLLLL